MTLYGTGTAPKTELLINNIWTDVSTRPRGEQKIVITRGRLNEQARVTAQTCNATVNNRDGVMSNRNPNSIYFGLLPRNTQMRITAGAGDNYLKLLYADVVPTSLAFVTTADKAVVRVTGDIDIRAEVSPDSWRPQRAMNIMAKYALTGNQRSWLLYIQQSGQLTFVWSPDGTAAARIFATSTAVVPSTAGHSAVRVTLDVDNGAAGNTATFYTSTAIGGTWTQLGSTVITAGTTSIFAGTAAITIGGGADNQSMIAANTGFGGKVYKAELWSGIAGTRVANMDATSRTVGDTSWSDGLGTPNTWTVFGTGSRITTDRIRFHGELSSLPQVWDISGRDVTVPVQASGMIRRLTQGANALRSPMYRNFSQYSPIGYWPLEDGSTATSAGSAVGGGAAGVATAITFGVAAADLPGTASVAQFQDATSRLQFACPKTTSSGTISGCFYTKLSSLPGTSKVLFTFFTSGTVRTVTVALSTTNWTTSFLAGDGTVLATSNVAVTGIDPSHGWVGFNLLMQTSGSDVTYSIRWDGISAFGGGVGPTTITTATLGVPTGAYTNSVADAAFLDAKVSHVFLSTTNFDLSSDVFRKASSAWAGETAAARLIRLGQEESIAIEVAGLSTDSEPMGAQPIDTFMNLVFDCWDTDGGVGGECRDKLALLYRCRNSLENRSDVTLSYTSSHLSVNPLPTEDDSAFTNDVTASRPGGTSVHVQNTDGATSVSDPPTGVGRYATAITRNVSTDARLSSVAGWAVLAGSWDDARYPQLTVGMHRTEIQSSATLPTALAGLEIGDTAILSGLPSWLPPDDVPEFVQGYTDTLGKFTWDIVYNCTPAGPYRVPILDSDVNPPRADAVTHTIGGSMTTTALSVTFVTPAGSALWVTTAVNPSEFPFNVKIAGEVMTVTAIVGASSPQTATVTRSVNGIVKTHSSGELVRLAVPSYVGR